MKEGTQSDPENKDALFRLLRYQANFTDKQNDIVSLEDYALKMVKDQNKIYFAFGQNYNAAMKSPFYEPFIGKDVPVLIITNQLDEFCFTQAGDYKGMQFMNIEQVELNEIKKMLGITDDDSIKSRLPEEDVTGFCLWLKDCMKSRIAKVQLSSRLSNTPAIVVGQMSSSMLAMMQMLQ